MSFEVPGDLNPFEAPRASIGEEATYLDPAVDGAEAIRREHIGREANVKSIGHLFYLGAFFLGLGTVVAIGIMAGIVPGGRNPDPEVNLVAYRVGQGIATFLFLLAASANAAVGFGLVRLHSWARWTAVVLIGLGLGGMGLYALVIGAAVDPIKGLIVLLADLGVNGLFLFLLLSPKAGVVFSPEYREVIRKTPHVKLKTSLIVKIILALILGLIAFVVASLIFGGD